MTACRLVFLLDVDNTLIDNDGLRDGLNRALAPVIGEARIARFWDVYEDVRSERDLVHFPTILDRFLALHPGPDRSSLEAALYEFDFAAWRFPRSLDVIAHLRTLGTALVTSDGDEVYQVAKVRRSGIEAAVDAVYIVPHKEEHYAAIERRFPADRYVAIDDKSSILAHARRHWGSRAFTVHIRHGKYAREDAGAGLEISDIGDLLQTSAGTYCPPSS